MESVWKKKSFWRAEISSFQVQLEKFSAKGNVFVLRKRRLFLFMQGNAKMKTFYKPTAATLFHCAQINGSQQISSAKSYCKLAAKQPIFETSQSCVCTTAPLSHRFKSSPAIPGKVAIPGAAGYLMNAGHFSESDESSVDLNRSPESRGSQTSGVLPVLFVQAKRIKPFPCRELRGFANLESAHPNNNFPLTKLNPFAASRLLRRLAATSFSYFL